MLNSYMLLVPKEQSFPIQTGFSASMLQCIGNVAAETIPVQVPPLCCHVPHKSGKRDTASHFFPPVFFPLS